MKDTSNLNNEISSQGSDPNGDVRIKERLDLAHHLPYRLSQVSRMGSIGASRLFQKRFGFGIREWRIIALLGDYGPASAADMVGPAAFDKATVSRAIGVLERGGIVERLPDASDGRKQVVRLTSKGVEVHDHIVPLSRMRGRMLESVLTQEERDQLFTILDKLAAHLEWLAREEKDDFIIE